MRRIASIALAVALACAAVAMQSARWSYTRAYGPFVKNGRIGRTVTEPRFTIRVDRVDGARTIYVPPTDYAKAQQIPATGVFVVVLATIEARHSLVYAGQARLHTRYGDYDPTDKLGGGGGLSKPLVTPLSYVRFEPGMPRRGAYVFDVPPAAVAGARLYVSDHDAQEAPFGFYRDDPRRFAAEVHVDLGLDPAEATRLTSRPPSGYAIPEPS
ncbi:hypothetical protein [Actinoallomurus rhizosphaericola]|uniref:hypothetical protein n=1 Tax=Actinoallomurus rhizosphaericola TaxID=2952536 RepID=UPI002090CB3D|nr:hypothetical protein [Actinoallomurus rhizosphaericola]MCO5993919.1 hypothetical protein [Actinoallomurus rhizosphaericola]